MWPKIMSSKLIDRLFTVAIAVLTIMLTQGLITKRDYFTGIKKDIDARPTREQVNTQYSELKDYVDIQDENGQKALKQYIEESRVSEKNVMELIKSIDGNVKILMYRTK